MRKIIIYFMIIVTFLLSADKAYANNIAVSNVSITGQSTSAQTCKIQFDISWENSWKNGINYDAAWVFMKYSTDSGATWSHATLKSTTTNPLNDGLGWSKGSNSDLAILVPVHDPAQSGDKKGAFLQRTANGTGTLSSTSVQFVWDWSSDKLSNDPNTAISASTTARIKVFAIEMVYIPTGSFYIGDGNGTTQSEGAFYQTANTAVQINNTLKGTIKCGNTSYDDSQLETTGVGIDGDGGLDTDNSGSVDNASFPTGYNGFYLMKYEISQGQYRDFLNTLTRTQQNTRTLADVSTDVITNVYVMSNTATVSDRQGIRCPASGNGTTAPISFGCSVDGDATFNEADDGEWIACNYLSWMDVAAYADWAGLRPMTELEFEKAARGSNTPVLSEYAWGHTNLTAFSSLANSGTTTEASGTTGANCNFADSLPDGPVRVGMFATASSTREQAGAGYYGVMELSGNVDERPVAVGNSTGRSFAGTHGNGSLSANGNANNSDWTGYVTSEVTAATGSGFRGKSWYSGTDNSRLCVSYRNHASLEDIVRYLDSGGRCARTAP